MHRPTVSKQITHFFLSKQRTSGGIIDMTIAFTFPGQGSQAVGMGSELKESFATARETFQEIDDALGQNLSKIMAEGPQETLTLTENAQPALMAVSMAMVRVLEKDYNYIVADHATFVAGHSLGEYSALAAAGAFSVADAARLLKTRGQAMQAAVPVGEGAMAALLGLELEDAQALALKAAEGDVCQVANDNAPGQVVISGAKSAVERAVDLAKEFGARRAVLLDVSAPFHCALMEPAVEVMADALAGVDVRAPSVPLVANVTSDAITTPEDVVKNLLDQVTGTVRWRESVGYIASNGVDQMLEIGSGKVLSGLARRIERSLAATPLGTPKDIDAYFEKLNA